MIRFPKIKKRGFQKLECRNEQKDVKLFRGQSRSYLDDVKVSVVGKFG